jgi:hypothetical protein
MPKTHLTREKMSWAGPQLNGSVRILVYCVDSEEEARKLFDNDPAVLAGIGHPELHPFHIGHLTGR